jgi:hypothetical protein
VEAGNRSDIKSLVVRGILGHPFQQLVEVTAGHTILVIHYHHYWDSLIIVVGVGRKSEAERGYLGILQ